MTLAIGPIFASRWLIPRLNRFHRQHPGIELVLHHGPRISAVQDLITDVAVDWGTGGWSDLDSGRLICPLDIALEPTRCYHLLTRPGARKNVEIESVCAWLANEADISRINWRG